MTTGILPYLLDVRYLVGVGVILCALVALFRAGLARKWAWFDTRLGKYVLGYGSAAVLYVGEALRTSAPITVGLFTAALAAGWVAAGGWEAFRDLVFHVIGVPPAAPPEFRPQPPQAPPPSPPSSPWPSARPIQFATMLIAVFVVASCASCASWQESKPGKVVIDCLSADQDKIEALTFQLTPLLFGEQPDWAAIEAGAVDAGATIGGCTLAGLIQAYLGGRKAVPVGESWRARDLLEGYRAQHAGGATFRTAAGDL